MKAMSGLLLFLFVAFLSTPTIVTLIEKNTDISVFYSFSEEEIHKDFKEIIANMNQETHFVFLNVKLQKNTKIISKNATKHDNVFEEIFSPPPEFS
jgi:hypothetical protein